MQLRSLTIKGHTSIRHAHLELRDVNVLVGANGAGKSNLIRALELLGRIVDGELQLSVGLTGGAPFLLRQPATEALELAIDFSDDGHSNGYLAKLQPTADDRLIFAEEQVTFQTPVYENPWVQHLGTGQHETALHAYAKKHEGASVAGHVLELMRGCRVFHFHDTSRTAQVKQPQPSADDLTLQSDARNLAALLRRLRDSEPGTFERIRNSIRQVAPFFRDFVLERDRNDYIQLRWRAVDSDTIFSGHQMSDGTLRFICLATLLLQPNPPELIAIDEPELGLHPYAIAQLADMLRAIARTGSQIMVATQSVTLLDQFVLADLMVVEHGPSGTVVDRPDLESLRHWLEDYSLGELWLKNLLGGRPGYNGR